MGWGLAGMWYDKFPGTPPRGSPLESLFLLVFLQRQESQIMATRALVQSTLPDTKAAADPAIEAYQKYCDMMLPFLGRAADTEKEEQRKRLMAFVQHPARISLLPIYKAQADGAKKLATFKRFKLGKKR